jgi:hypothetical protein
MFDGKKHITMGAPDSSTAVNCFSVLGLFVT